MGNCKLVEILAEAGADVTIVNNVNLFPSFISLYTYYPTNHAFAYSIIVCSYIYV